MQKKILTACLSMTLIAMMAIGMQMQPVNAMQSQGTYNTGYGSETKGIVCGDKLCSEVDIPKQSTSTTTEPTTQPAITKPKDTMTNSCNSNSIKINSDCLNFNITGAKVKSSSFDKTSGSIVIQIQSTDDGEITIDAVKSVLNTISMVLVDGEEWDDVSSNGSNIVIDFYAGTEKIEIFGN